MDYSQLSDFEINGYVESVVCGFKEFEFVDRVRGLILGSGEGAANKTESLALSYCTDGGESMPLIIKNKIGLLWVEDSGKWCACAGGSVESDYWGWDECPDFYYEHVNPLRAAMIVFLMMQGNYHA